MDIKCKYVARYVRKSIRGLGRARNEAISSFSNAMNASVCCRGYFFEQSA